jgi:hypothetical protein
VEGAGADLEVERLDEDATLRGPVMVQAQDQFLESRGGGRRQLARGVETKRFGSKRLV